MFRQLGVLIVASSVFAFVAPLTVAAADFSGIESRLSTECASGYFAGIVLIKSPGDQVYEHICGSSNLKGMPISLDTRFKIFSTTKLLTAVAVMRLVETGKLDLDGSITSYIPEAPHSWQGVTIHQLLQHRSGLPDQTERILAVFKTDYAAAMNAVLAEDQANGTAPATTPGTEWKYNNFGYDLLATAAAAAMHTSFEKVLDSLVFQPANMRSAVLEKGRLVRGKLESEPDPELAQGFNGSANKREPATSLEFLQLGSGSVHAKVGDFLALDAALKSGKLLRPATLAQMQTDVSPFDAHTPSGRGYGLGMMIRGTAPLIYIGHDGGSNGFMSDFERYADGTVLIVMSNLGYADMDWIRSAVAELVFTRSPSGRL